MLCLTAEQLVFIDESLFNEITGWRHYAYILVGDSARYHASCTRGHFWSVLPTFIIDRYFCVGVKKG